MRDIGAGSSYDPHGKGEFGSHFGLGRSGLPGSQCDYHACQRLGTITIHGWLGQTARLCPQHSAQMHRTENPTRVRGLPGVGQPVYSGVKSGLSYTSGLHCDYPACQRMGTSTINDSLGQTARICLQHSAQMHRTENALFVRGVGFVHFHDRKFGPGRSGLPNLFS